MFVVIYLLLEGVLRTCCKDNLESFIHSLKPSLTKNYPNTDVKIKHPYKQTLHHTLGFNFQKLKDIKYSMIYRTDVCLLVRLLRMP